MKHLSLLLGVLLLAAPITAQNDNPKARSFAEQLRTQHIAYITEATQFTPEEAEKFWPIYNEYKKVWFNIMRQTRRETCAFNKNPHVSDQEYRDQYQMIIEMRVKEVNNMQEYYERISEVLSPRSMWLFYDAEERFFRSFMTNRRKSNNKKQ